MLYGYGFRPLLRVRFGCATSQVQELLRSVKEGTQAPGDLPRATVPSSGGPAWDTRSFHLSRVLTIVISNSSYTDRNEHPLGSVPGRNLVAVGAEAAQALESLYWLGFLTQVWWRVSLGVVDLNTYARLYICSHESWLFAERKQISSEGSRVFHYTSPWRNVLQAQ